MTPAALPWIGAALLLGGMCFGGLLVLLFLAVVGRLPTAHIEVHEPPAPRHRRGHHIRWEHDRQRAQAALERSLDDASTAHTRAGLLDDTRTQWATNPTELHPRQEA